MTQTGFAVWHPTDRALYIGFVAAAWLVVLMGFAPSVATRFAGKADYAAPLSLVIHVWSFVGWMTLLTLQVILINVRWTNWHKRMGLAAMVLIPVMAVSAIMAEAYSERFYAVTRPEAIRFFIVPLTFTAMFAIVATAALLLRKDPSAHKRLILIATALPLVAAFGRWFAPAIIDLMGDNMWGDFVANALGVNVMIGAGMAHDLATRGRLHRVYVIAVPPILAVQLLSAWVYHTDWWPGVVRWMLEI